MTIELPRCPDCGSIEVVPIVYGNMRHRAMDLALQGRLHLGSTLISRDPPIWHCKGCNNDLPPHMGSLWRPSASRRLHTRVLRQLRQTYRALSERDRQLLAGRNGLRAMVSIILASNPREIRLWRSGEVTHVVALPENDSIELPSPPVHLFNRILEYVCFASSPTDGSTRKQLIERVSVRGNDQAFVVTVEENRPNPALVIRPTSLERT
jgi:hypothetical protein